MQQESKYKRLPRHLMAYNREHLPAPIVMSTVEPYIWGKVWRWKDEYEYMNFVSNYNGLGIAVVPGYKIAISVGGVLTGMSMRATTDILTVIQNEMRAMVEFYRTERIEDKLSFYKKFKLI